MRTHSHSCGCFVKVFVCDSCRGVADEYLSARIRDLTDQLQLGIVDTMVSVSDSGNRGTDAKYKA